VRDSPRVEALAHLRVKQTKRTKRGGGGRPSFEQLARGFPVYADGLTYGKEKKKETMGSISDKAMEY